jgi:hypothetical protein
MPCYEEKDEDEKKTTDAESLNLSYLFPKVYHPELPKVSNPILPKVSQPTIAKLSYTPIEKLSYTRIEKLSYSAMPDYAGSSARAKEAIAKGREQIIRSNEEFKEEIESNRKALIASFPKVPKRRWNPVAREWDYVE